MTESHEIKSLRYSSHLRLDGFTQQSQKKLNAASVLIIGIGGLGTTASLYLANSGIGKIIVNDYDSEDLTNLPRQILYNSDDLGNNKAETAVVINFFILILLVLLNVLTIKLIYNNLKFK